MFDVRLRDKLLFEDSHFTYSRRYFWAYNTLGVINEGIKSMRSAYLTTFSPSSKGSSRLDFWSGRHPTLWPHPEPDSTAGREYALRMDVLRQELESAVAELQVMHDKNEGTRTEIRSLREQLFSGSSVKESRRAIEQGDNIKILTSVSMIFLPLTFVVVSVSIYLLPYFTTYPSPFHPNSSFPPCLFIFAPPCLLVSHVAYFFPSSSHPLPNHPPTLSTSLLQPPSPAFPSSSPPPLSHHPRQP
jgi:hypothetical protein